MYMYSKEENDASQHRAIIFSVWHYVRACTIDLSWIFFIYLLAMYHEHGRFVAQNNLLKAFIAS